MGDSFKAIGHKYHGCSTLWYSSAWINSWLHSLLKSTERLSCLIVCAVTMSRTRNMPGVRETAVIMSTGNVAPVQRRQLPLEWRWPRPGSSALIGNLKAPALSRVQSFDGTTLYVRKCYFSRWDGMSNKLGKLDLFQEEVPCFVVARKTINDSYVQNMYVLYSFTSHNVTGNTGSVHTSFKYWNWCIIKRRTNQWNDSFVWC